MAQKCRFPQAWVEPEQVLRGSSFAESASSLAPREWAAFQRGYAARLQRAVLTAVGPDAADAADATDAATDAADAGAPEDEAVSSRVAAVEGAIETVRAECARWLLPVDIAAVGKTALFLSAFPMFVPSLSWQNDRFYI
jgi:hypothetical protein